MSLLAPIGFGLAVLPLCLTPGVSFTLVTDRVLGVGVRAGLAVIVGTCAGLLTHALLAAAGLSALVMSSTVAFQAVKLLGAIYLIVIGIRTLRSTRSAAPEPARRNPFLQGYLGNVLNPKAAAVHLTLAPQFLDTGRPLFPQLMVLSIAHVLVAGAWLVTWTTVVHRTRRTFRTNTLRTATSRVAGLVLIGLGVRTVVMN
ncbi:LysE family translocator [Kribbella sandramycini]|uniref:LysE family translocator n=1 Tax=Kribbella sandramycini TaxID=60450 RepID=A0A7Y4KY29_9ACTN|nr:LysE family translocator [Kribbella sandramycini]MBB6569378.1 threonine/homoserine/homoserine lactone efflux protein [Kribbella sandramycini]NOL40784.1 LysE family translocator [Kribbella sandramycini]